MEDDVIEINVKFGRTKFEISFQSTKRNVVATAAFISAQIAALEEDPNIPIIDGLTGQLKDINDQLEQAQIKGE